MNNLNRKSSFWVLSFVFFIVCSTGYFLTPTKYPEKLPETSEELGEVLFMDKLLSKDKSISCASCHKPEFAFADTTAGSLGVGGKITGRNTPTATYMKDRVHYFWDGRAKTLEEQAAGPIANPNEMALPISEAVERLKNNDYYSKAFMHLYNQEPDSALLVKAIADFERTLETYDSPYDRFMEGDMDAMSDSAMRGFYLFFRENSCANDACHPAETAFGGDSLIVFQVNNALDSGLYAITKEPADIGKFKSPVLRNVALTAPYLHDGSLKTLREVVEFYNEMENFPRESNVHSSLKKQRVTHLTEQQIDDLVAFMEALTDERYLKYLNVE